MGSRRMLRASLASPHLWELGVVWKGQAGLEVATLLHSTHVHGLAVGDWPWRGFDWTGSLWCQAVARESGIIEQLQAQMMGPWAAIMPVSTMKPAPDAAGLIACCSHDEATTPLPPPPRKTKRVRGGLWQEGERCAHECTAREASQQPSGDGPGNSCHNNSWVSKPQHCGSGAGTGAADERAHKRSGGCSKSRRTTT